MSWYEITLTPDDDTLMVTAPAFPEVTSFGASEAEALHWGALAIEEAIAARMHDKEPLPAPVSEKEPGKVYVQVPTWDVTSSGDVFSELGIRVDRIKIEIAADICHRIARQGWSLEQASTVAGADLERVCRGDVGDFTVEQLNALLTALKR